MKQLSRNDIIFAGTVLLAVFVFIKFLSVISSIILLGFLSSVFAAIINRPVSFIAKITGRPLAVILCILSIIALILTANRIIIPAAAKDFTDFSKEIPAIQKKINKEIDRLEIKYRINLDKIQKSEYITENTKKIIPFIIGGATKIGMSVIQVAVDTVLIFLLTLYMLLDPKSLIRGFADPWDFDTKKKILRVIRRCEKMLFAWAVGLLCGMLCMFLLSWAGLSLIHFRNAFLFAFLAGVLNIIPTLGPFIAAVPPVIFSLAENPVNVIYVLIIYIVMHQAESHILTPLIMKKQLDIHPAVLILAILVMMTFFGMIGAFITAPVCAGISIIYDEFFSKPKKNNSLSERN